MKTQKSATQKVLTKLNALRATLSDDERKVLDSIVIHDEDEVAAHRIGGIGILKTEPRQEPKADARSMPKVETGEDEVVAHRMGAIGILKTEPRQEPKVESRTSPLIVFDVEKGEYVTR